MFMGASVAVRAIVPQEVDIAELERTHSLVGVFVVARIRVDALPVFVAVDGWGGGGGLGCRGWRRGMGGGGECGRDPAVGVGVHFRGAVDGC